MMDVKTKAYLTDIRSQFPFLRASTKRIIYFDNAATTQKPDAVIATMREFYEKHCANVHRGTHQLTAKATELYEEARVAVKNFIHAPSEADCIFTKGTTESINLVAHGFIQEILKPNDEVIISQLEHHSNIVPWQLACEYKGAKLRVIPCTEQGELNLDVYQNLLNERTKLVAIQHVSNALGTIHPIETMILWAHRNNTPVLIDGAQAAPHLSLDMRKLNCDFYAFSGHKMYGPTGIGVLYGKPEWLERLPPYQAGGEMIEKVTLEKTTFRKPPLKFEAGTPPIAEVIGLKAAIDFINTIGLNYIFQHEQNLLEYATEALQTIPTLRILGQPKHKSAVISFLMDNIHSHDIGTILDARDICIRTGRHCAEPTMDFFNISGTARASFGVYNTIEEIDVLIQALTEVYALFNRK